jgi:hypothetical protein
MSDLRNFGFDFVELAFGSVRIWDFGFTHDSLLTTSFSYTEEPSDSELGEAKSGEPQRTTELNPLRNSEVLCLTIGGI